MINYRPNDFRSTRRQLADRCPALKASVSCTDLVRDLGLDTLRTGFIRCPMHDDKHASLKVYPAARGWFCFSCHAHGDVVDLFQALTGATTAEAIAQLSDRYLPGGGETLPPIPPTKAEPDIPSEAEAAALIADAVLDRYADADRMVGTLDPLQDPDGFAEAIKAREMARQEADFWTTSRDAARWEERHK